MLFVGMLSAPEAFMAIANATASIVQKAPPYVTYRVHGVVQVRNGEGTVDRIVTVRTEDGNAIVRDSNAGTEALKPPFPAPPNFDALSNFQFRWTVNFNALRVHPRPDFDMHVWNVEPLHYSNVASRADVVVRSVRGYVITYAGDATTQQGHLQLEPSAQRRGEADGWLTDVWYDPQTMIPTRVVYGGQHEFVLDARYATTDGVWLLSSIAVSTAASARGLGRVTMAFRGEYGEYRFSTSPPDPRLAPLGTPQPVGT